MHQGDDFGNFAAERAGIHDQPAADSAGDTFAEFEPLEAPIDNVLDQGSERGGGTRDNFDAITIELYFFKTSPKTRTRTRHPGTAMKKVVATPRQEHGTPAASAAGLTWH